MLKYFFKSTYQRFPFIPASKWHADINAAAARRTFSNRNDLPVCPINMVLERSFRSRSRQGSFNRGDKPLEHDRRC